MKALRRPADSMHGKGVCTKASTDEVTKAERFQEALHDKRQADSMHGEVYAGG